MMRRDDSITLLQMLDHVREAMSVCSSRSRIDLEFDRMFFLATLKIVEIVCEAATRLSQETQELAPEIHWRWITGTRNRLIHGYDSIDLNILWEIVSGDFPILEKQLSALILKLEERKGV